MDLKEKFYKVYNNLPLALREEIVLVVKDEPITWRVARLEIDNDIRQLVIARLRSFSSGRKISIGSDGELTAMELIKKVEEKDNSKISFEHFPQR